MNEPEIHQIYTKNDSDFAIHRIENGWIYGVVYASKDRGRLHQTSTPYALRKVTVEEFKKMNAELV